MQTKDIETTLGISKQTLIHYENEGLITPQRNKNNYRDYSSQDLETLKLIHALRAINVSIKDIKSVLNQQVLLSDILKKQTSLLEKSIEELQKIESRITQFSKRHNVYLCFSEEEKNEIPTKYEPLIFLDNYFLFDEKKILISDIKKHLYLCLAPLVF